MKKIYACLVGNWVCLNDDPDCVVGDDGQSPSLWFEESAPIYKAPQTQSKSDSYYENDYVNVFYLGKHYRINPIFIQIVNE